MLTTETCFPGRYNAAEDRWVPVPDDESGRAAASSKVDELKVATFNTWFGDYHFGARARALFEILESCDADVIGLQEVTQDLHRRVLAEDWIQRDYYCSDITGITIVPYGVLLLSRLPFRNVLLHDLPTLMGRRALIAEYVVHGEDLLVSTVHLESLGSAPIRAEQLEIIFPLLKKRDHAIFMGDFNLCASWRENEHLDASFLDLWAYLRGDELGYTVDSAVNKMRFELRGKQKRVRFDRVLLRSVAGRWQPRSIRLLGTEAIAPEPPAVYPSDHFGLTAAFGFKPEAG